MKNTGFIHPECAEKRHQEFQKQLGDKDLEMGSYVKLKFNAIDSDIFEHMWVEVTRKLDTADFYTGILDNDPVHITHLKCGDQITFQKKSVQDIYHQTK